MRLHRFLAGNPAISCPCRTQDRRLCVPALRRVCLYIARPVNTQKYALARTHVAARLRGYSQSSLLRAAGESGRLCTSLFGDRR